MGITESAERPSVVLSAIHILALLGVSLWGGMWVAEHAHALLTALPLPSFLAIPLEYQAQAPIIRTLVGVVAGFLLFFALGYVLQSLWDAWRLALAASGVARRAEAAASGTEIAPPGQWRWGLYPLFSALWREFAASLHAQREGDALRFRAGQAAGVIFSHQALVDGPMRVEFFRHLPGVLTGAGIVSTFAGILLGLTEFNPTVSADQVTAQLKHLFTGVSTAFVASFLAIFTAIVVTVVEKLILHWRYAQVTRLQGLLDSLFQGGLEADFLERLSRDQAREGADLAGLGDRLEALARGNVPPSAEAMAEALGRRLEGIWRDHAANSAESVAEALAARLEARQEQVERRFQEGLARSLYQPLHELSNASQALLAAQKERGSALEEMAGLLRSGGEGLGGAVGGFSATLEQWRLESNAVLEQWRVESNGGQERLESALERLIALTEALQRQGAEAQAGLRQELAAVRQGVQQSLAEEGQGLQRAWMEEQQGLKRELAAGVEAVRQEVSSQTALLAEKLGTGLSGVADRLEAAAAAARQEVGQRVEGLSDALREEARGGLARLEGIEAGLVAARQGLDQGVASLRDEWREGGGRVEEGIRRIQEEMLEQAEARWVMTSELTQAMRDATQESTREAARREEALFHRMKEGQGELSARVEAARAEQEERAKALTVDLLQAFADYLREMAAGLGAQLNTLGERVSRERQAMEALFQNLIGNLVEASRAGGEDLAGRLQTALAGAEVRQNDLLDALTRFAADMRADVNVLQHHMVESRESLKGTLEEKTGELARQTREQAEEARQWSELEREEAERVMRETAGGMASDLKEVLHRLAEERLRLDRERDDLVSQLMAAGQKETADQLKGAFLESLRESAQTMSAALSQTGDRQERQVKDLAEMVTAVLINKLEQTFGGLSSGLS
ncbi:MAG: hypothetical protein HQL51_15960, partial [Magnetococcales bacterium]|nr:hypothetical protein [Magnetococcales bacterium]